MTDDHPPSDPEKQRDEAIDGVAGPRWVSSGEKGPAEIDNRRSKHTTKFDTLSDAPRVYGKRPHLAKEGREIANTAVGLIRREQPECVEDPDDPTLADVLKYMSTEDGVAAEETATLCDLLSEGLTFREAVTWFLYERGGLTLREIYHVDEGKERSFSKEDDRQAERNVAATLSEAAEKLGVDVDVVME